MQSCHCSSRPHRPSAHSPQHAQTHPRSDDPAFDGAIYAARVTDSRPLSGEAGGSARVVTGLPFSDAGDTSKFGDDYTCQAQDAAPDVVYSLTPEEDMQVGVVVCVLLVHVCVACACVCDCVCKWGLSRSLGPQS